MIQNGWENYGRATLWLTFTVCYMENHHCFLMGKYQLFLWPFSIAFLYVYWLVVGPPLWKIWKSIGMISNPIYGKMPKMATKPPTSLPSSTPMTSEPFRSFRLQQSSQSSSPHSTQPRCSSATLHPVGWRWCCRCRGRWLRRRSRRCRNLRFFLGVRPSPKTQGISLIFAGDGRSIWIINSILFFIENWVYQRAEKYSVCVSWL